MNILTKIKDWLSKEINTDWRIIALDLNQALIETQEKLQEANQRITDLEKIVLPSQMTVCRFRRDS
ncbi:TPA: hypothetical protein ACLWZ5_001156 [Streptococcus pneumoniae]